MIRCLMIEDNSFDRKVLRQAAADCGLTLELKEAASIQAADDILETDSFDCIMLDFRLPDGDGLSFAKRFLASDATDTALVMLTAEGSEQLANEALQIGILDYLPKESLSSESLERSITNALAKVRLRCERRAALEELRRSNEALGRFAAVVAHDLKAPIRQMKLFSSFLSEDYKSALGKEGQDLLHTIERAAERAFKLIDGMLAYARLDRAGEERIEVDLRAMLDQAMSNLTDLIEDTGARFDIDALPTVVAVEPQLMQLFQNLINNALKFRHPERPLLIRVRAKTMGPDSWRISVEDNGIGIAEKDQDRIFNMLERGHCQKNYEGSGIGLATCRRIVENHHGEIWCRSTKDVGSTFLFTLERENSATASADRRSSRTLPRRQWRPSPGRRLDVKSARSENAGLAPASFSVLAIRWFSDLHDAFTEACGRAGRTGFP